MPSLYSPRVRPHLGKFPEENLEGEYFIQRGDALYIPRGCPHEADTIGMDSECSVGDVVTQTNITKSVKRVESIGEFSELEKVEKERAPFVKAKGEECKESLLSEEEEKEGNSCKGDERDASNERSYSLHVTFALEVEPLFQWQGFLHIAIRAFCIEGGSKQSIRDESIFSASRKRLWQSPFYSPKLDVSMASEWLLHFEIHRLALIHPELRKACLIGATCKESVVHGLPYIPPKGGVLESERPQFSDNWFRIVETENCSSSIVQSRELQSWFTELVKWVCTDSTFDNAILTCEEVGLDRDQGEIRWWAGLWEGEQLFSSVLSQIKELRRGEEVSFRLAFASLKQQFIENGNFVMFREAFMAKLFKLREVRRLFTLGMLQLHSCF